MYRGCLLHLALIGAGGAAGCQWGALHGSGTGLSAAILGGGLGGLIGLVAGHLLGVAILMLLEIPGLVWHGIRGRAEERRREERRQRYFARLAAERERGEPGSGPSPG